MWVIKTTNGIPVFSYLQYIYSEANGNIQLEYNREAYAFRFPDEQTAQAVLKFLNRDNLEVACINHPGSDR